MDHAIHGPDGTTCLLGNVFDSYVVPDPWIHRIKKWVDNITFPGLELETISMANIYKITRNDNVCVRAHFFLERVENTLYLLTPSRSILHSRPDRFDCWQHFNNL
jgi:hypothetical protein